MNEQNFNDFLKKAEEISDFIKEEASKNSKFIVVTHFDADGLASGGIICKALIRLNTFFHLKVVEQLTEEVLFKISRINGDVIIFSEIGSGYLSLIKNYLKDKKIVVIDHHQVESNVEIDFPHLNPHNYGFDGGKDISGSGVTYFMVKMLNEKNMDLSPLAIVGALGDAQDKNPQRALKGLNEEIVKEAEKARFLNSKVDLILHGKETKPIHKALAYSTNPFLPGLTGEEDKCVALISSIGIPLKRNDEWTKLSDLSMEDKQKLLTKIIEHLSSHGFSGSIALNLIGVNYEILTENKDSPLRDAREYAFILNACGRMSKAGLGIALCLGDRENALNKVQQLILEYKQLLAKHINWIIQSPEKIQEFETFYAIRGEETINEKMTGAISTMLASSTMLKPDKAVLVLALSGKENIKVSARAGLKFTEKKVNLGTVLKICAEKFSGLGGGHEAAAGAYIPKDKIEDFLKTLNEEILKTLKNEG
ncbi:MAG: DHH family phosphoesterase [Candidatus Bathyarchaeia archaeon]